MTSPSDPRYADKVRLYEDLVALYEATGAARIPNGKGGVYWPNGFRRKFTTAHRSEGSDVVVAVAELMRADTSGFDLVADAGRADLLLETLVLDDDRPYHYLFSARTKDLARERLRGHGLDVVKPAIPGEPTVQGTTGPYAAPNRFTEALRDSPSGRIGSSEAKAEFGGGGGYFGPWAGIDDFTAMCRHGVLEDDGTVVFIVPSRDGSKVEYRRVVAGSSDAATAREGLLEYLLDPPWNLADDRFNLFVDMYAALGGDPTDIAARVSAPPCAFILTWNPTKWAWDPDQLMQWSVGNRTSGVRPGDRAYLLRQHDHRGLIASGTFMSEVFQAAHWDGSGTTANYAQVDWDTVIDPVAAPERGLPVDELKRQFPDFPWDNLMSSGVQVPEADVSALHDLWRAFAGSPRPTLWPDEEGLDQTFTEGGVTRVLVNRYERSPEAREACIRRWGASCYVCGMDFATRYGDYARGTIEVHHLQRVADQGGVRYEVDPVNDLRPLCPNCHAAVHRRDAPPIDEMRAAMQPGV